MEDTTLRLSKARLKKIVYNTEKAAEAIDLIYVNDSQEGIRRMKKGKNFIYKYKGKTLTDFETLARIKSLVIPPAWRHVWICTDEKGHLQATGFDVRNRKQYKYHPSWNALRNHTKFFNLYDFGKTLPAIRARLYRDVAKQGLPQEKVLAAVVYLMQCTCIRIGSHFYEKMNGSFGLTTLKDNHVKIKGQQLKFSFKGKKSVYHNITLKSKKLAKIVQACKDIPGKELFQYYDENGERKSIDSGMVNSYIKEVSGGNFSAKDFRTWAGSLQALIAFRQSGCCDTETASRKKTVEVLDKVARQLNNTRAVCKKYYVHPALIDMYREKLLEKYFPAMDEDTPIPSVKPDLSKNEKVLLTILKTLQ